MGEDEVATVRTLTAYREEMATVIRQHRGRVVDSPGDNLLAEFASVVDAVQCAVEIQQQLKVQNAELPAHRRMEFRMGINLGDVIVEGERIYGDGVNIAARIEGLAEPGGICLSGIVHEQVKHKVALHYEGLGEQEVKNIAEPVQVWRVVMDDAAATLARQFVLRQARPERSRRAQHERFPNEIAQPSPVTLSPSKGEQRIFEHPAGRKYWQKIVLVSDLSKISSLFVIARNSAFTYKGKAVKVQDVGREMGVRYVLEGSVQKADGQVRIVAQLIDTTTGGHIAALRKAGLK